MTDGSCCFMNTARPRVHNQSPDGSAPRRASIRSIQKLVPLPRAASASYIARIVRPALNGAGTAGTGSGSPVNTG
jgi:hypothetical protein